MKQTNTARPRLTVPNTEQIKQVHNHSLQILSSVGVRVDSDRAQQIFRQAIGSTMADGDRVRIPRELVEWALEATPAELDIYSTIGIVQDVPPEISDLYATLEMRANTTKPLVILVSKAIRP